MVKVDTWMLMSKTKISQKGGRWWQHRTGVINDEEKSPCHGKKQQIRCHGLFSFRSSHFYAPLGFRFFPTVPKEPFLQMVDTMVL